MKRRSIMMAVGILLLLITLLAACAGDEHLYPISQAEAKRIAASELGVDIQNASYAVVTNPDGKGKAVYTVEIMLEGVVYRYDIDAKTGNVHKLYINDEPIEPSDEPTFPGSANDSYIGLERAKQIAFENVGIHEGQLNAFDYELDFAYGEYLYKIEFVVNGTEYEYEIRAKDGTIFKKDVERNTVVEPHIGNKSFIGIEKAKEASLSHAKVAKEMATILHAEWDMEKGVAVYEVEFTTKEGKYKYKIHAETGEVILNETDVKDHVQGNSNLTHNHITKEEAKRIASAHAGIAQEKMKKYEIELDFERGVEVYEIEFQVGKTEYEYKIDVKSGEILKAEYEID